MLFNSRVFVGFFLVVYALYLALLRRHRLQNVLLLVASCIFYGYWDYRFLALLALSTTVDFWAALVIEKTPSARVRQGALAASIGCNVGLLAFFKYFNFFADTAGRLLALLGFRPDFITLHLILPIGISFYTFQAMSYTIDVYRGKLAATGNYIDFALMVMFFPHLVAGPIVRATSLLPQVQHERHLEADHINAAVLLLLWGYFKKVVIADHLASVTAMVFDQQQAAGGLDVLVGVLAFTFQIYCDFSGYSDIARGLAKLMGFELSLNFNLPYLAKSPSEFWQRWHISLSAWLRDYLYIPLGGNRGPAAYANLMVTMLVGGLWHGASWCFVLWGAYHGVILTGYHALRRHGAAVRSRFPLVMQALGLLQVPLMFVLTVVGWIIFRSHSVGQMVDILEHVGLRPSPLHGTELLSKLLCLTAPLLAVQWVQQRSGNLLALSGLKLGARAVVYTGLLVAICLAGERHHPAFIYFQF